MSLVFSKGQSLVIFLHAKSSFFHLFFLFENSSFVSLSSIIFSFHSAYLPFTFRLVIQSSHSSCYAVLHFYLLPPLHTQSFHTTSWVQTSVQFHYLYSFLVHLLKFLFCPIYNSSTVPRHTYSPSIHSQNLDFTLSIPLSLCTHSQCFPLFPSLILSS